MKILLSTLVLLLATTSFAKSPKKDYLNDESMKMINLVGVRVLLDNTDDYLFESPEGLHKLEHVSKELKQMIHFETGLIPASGVYAAGNVNVNNNAYIFVGKQTVSPKYVLAMILTYDDGSTTSALFTIEKATAGKLTLTFMGEEETPGEATIEGGTFWPY